MLQAINDRIKGWLGGLVIIMIGTLLASEMDNHHHEHLTTLITLITLLGAAVSLVIVYRRHQHIDLATVAPALLRSSLNALTEGVLLLDNRERIILARVPKPLQDTSIGLVTAGILSLTFYAFKGMI